MVVGILSVRLMLQALGVDDYGLLNVAGSLAGVFSFITIGLSTGVSRFTTFELGRGDIDRMRRSFSSSMIVFLTLGIVIIVILETAGLWYLRNYIVVPPGKEDAAFYVFQASVLYVFITICRVPYSAVVLAHEKFGLLAGVEVGHAFARLGLIIYAGTLPEDSRVVAFAILQSLLPALHILIYIIYTRRYPETGMKFRFDPSILRPVIGFSIWEMLGAIGRTLKSSGFNMVVNFFCGVAMNATLGIAATVSGAVTGLAYTLSSVFFPGLVKAYARKDMDEFHTLACRASLGSMVLYSMIAMPLISECGYVLGLWLGNPPELSNDVCIIYLVANSILMAVFVGCEAIRAAGTNCALNVLQCISAALVIALVAGVFYVGMSPVVACAVFCLDVLFSLIIVAALMARYFGFAMVMRYISESVIKVLIVGFAVYLLISILTSRMEPSFLRLLLSGLVSLLSFAALSFTFLFTRSERKAIVSCLRSHFNPTHTPA